MNHFIRCPRCDHPMDQVQVILPGGKKEVTKHSCYECDYAQQDSPRPRHHKEVI